MQYHIISGHVIETRRCYMSARGEVKKKRGTRVAGSSSERKIMLNERDSVKRLARILNTNYCDGLVFLTLKYSNDRLPSCFEDARAYIAKVMRSVKREYKKQSEHNLKAVVVTANYSPKHKRAARLHHHIVLPADISLDLLSKCWPEEEFHVRKMGRQKDLTYLAKYLLDNVQLDDAGKKKYTCTHGMEKPRYTEPVPVDQIEDIEALPQTFVLEAEPTYNEDGLMVGAYMRSFAYSKPKVRGSMIILPKKKRGVKPDELCNEDMRGLLQEDE